jgi:hypothetical protein
MSDFFETRRVDGKIITVYTDLHSKEYQILNGQRVYFSSPAGDEDREDWCPLCGGNHPDGEGSPGYSCEG